MLVSYMVSKYLMTLTHVLMYFPFGCRFMRPMRCLKLRRAGFDFGFGFVTRPLDVLFRIAVFVGQGSVASRGAMMLVGSGR